VFAAKYLKNRVDDDGQRSGDSIMVRVKADALDHVVEYRFESDDREEFEVVHE